jgi:hypothetical protein
MYRIALTKRFDPVLFGNPPKKYNFNNHFLVIIYLRNIRSAIKLQQRFLNQGIQTDIEIVNGYNINEYALCTKKTYLLRLIQRKWKRLYHHWKRTLPRKLMYRQIGYKLPRII